MNESCHTAITTALPREEKSKYPEHPHEDAASEDAEADIPLPGLIIQ